MCGISGIINKNNQPVKKEEIKKINDLIYHRGPDDEGYFFGKNFAFGHRRLAILDLGKTGHQPMKYEGKNGEYVIIHNGEIYNYLELRNELIKEGYKFNSNTDTEVILASYDKYQEDCVNKFNGMWAFAIYDKKREIIFCSRDRFGIKPFYYTEVDNKFVFGSEIKQLLEYHPYRYANKSILMDYLVVGFEEHTHETFFESIFKLEQSHNLTYDLKSNCYKIKRYYDIKSNNEIKKMNEKDSIKFYKEVFENSIKLRLRSDVKVGVCLSGGLDSSSIAGIASKIYTKENNTKLIAIHAKSIQKDNDESKFAEDVAKYCNLDLNIVKPMSKDFLNKIAEVIYTQEEPFGSPSIFMQYFVMKKAKELNCKVMLDGQGGDETLLGYERYYPAYLMSLGMLNTIKGFIQASRNSKLTISQLMQYFIYFTNPTIRIKRLKYKNSYIKKEFLDRINKNIIIKHSYSYKDIYKLQKYETLYTQMPHLLKYEDKNSMRNSIETRLPFIDYRVVETAININNSFKIKDGWTKYILRRVVEKILPNNIVWRKNKFGFEAPTKSWLKNIELEMQNVINNSTIINTISKNIEFNKLDDNQKWKLFNIAKWEKFYNVSIN